LKNSLRLACTLLLLAGLCPADTIYLNDGTSITAKRVTRTASEVRYVAGGAEQTIPSSSVSRIEPGSGMGISIGTSSSGWIAPSRNSTPTRRLGEGSQKASNDALADSLASKSAKQNPGYPALGARIIGSSGVSNRALYDIESEGDSSQTVAAYLIASHYSYEHGDSEAAQRYLRRCLRLAPAQPAVLQWNAFLLMERGEYAAAVRQAKRAEQEDPKSVGALRVLGMAYYHSGRFDDAIATWKRAQKLEPAEFITAYLEKAKREQGVEGNFFESQSAHFMLRYEGSRTELGFAPELLSTLGRQYVALQNELGFSPGITITVIVYTGRKFSDATRAPDWAGGINDGKIRIPVRNLKSVTPELERVLRHEMAHSFIHAYVHGACPTWLQEGIAQMVEPDTSGALAGPLGRAFDQGRTVPLRYLEGSFLGLSSSQAELAYAESLAAVEYLRSAKGVYGLRRILDALNEGDEPEDALQRAVQLNYKELESGIAGYLLANAR